MTSNNILQGYNSRPFTAQRPRCFQQRSATLHKDGADVLPFAAPAQCERAAGSLPEISRRSILSAPSLLIAAGVGTPAEAAGTHLPCIGERSTRFHLISGIKVVADVSDHCSVNHVTICCRAGVAGTFPAEQAGKICTRAYWSWEAQAGRSRCSAGECVHHGGSCRGAQAHQGILI